MEKCVYSYKTVIQISLVFAELHVFHQLPPDITENSICARTHRQRISSRLQCMEPEKQQMLLLTSASVTIKHIVLAAVRTVPVDPQASDILVIKIIIVKKHFSYSYF